MDAAFLYLETPSTHMHVQALMLLDPSTVPGGYSFAKIKAHIASRVPGLAEFRQRLAPVPFDMHRPVWFDDPDFDLDYHVRHIAVPPPGDVDQLADIVGELAGRPLDRARPLWEFWIIEGVENDAVAVVAKMHHATIDGVSGSSMATQLYDLEPRAIDELPSDDDWEPEHKPSDFELLRHAIISRLRRPFPLAAALMTPQLVRSGFSVMRARRDPSTPAGGTPMTAPRTPFNAPITPHRRVAFTSVPLAEVKAIKNYFGCTVNDVVLATATGALRAYLSSLDALPDRPLLAACPVSVRSAETEDIESANKVSAMFVPLPTHLDDPAAHIDAIRQSTTGAKQEHNAIGARTLLDLGESAAPRLFGLASRLLTGFAARGPVAVNVVISNVPGPPFPLYLGGARLVSMLPMGPPVDGIGLNITVMSYLDHVDWGFIACRELAPQLWDLAHAVGDAHRELVKASTP
jgi:diacylglycerol O-acyltransferase / wax synthase